ncbi:MAG: hypothetical protein SFX73_04540 [Kofleriaceae bacterium]|nr:hypothetical protein [Kofleriaceae bacterium]
MLFVVSMGACSGADGCGGCSATAPLPQGGLPKDQTLEGGAQIRVTPSGFTKLSQIVPSLLGSGLAGGVNVPRGDLGGWALGAEYCYSPASGCTVNVSLNTAGTSVAVTGPQTLTVDVSANVQTSIPLRGWIGCVTIPPWLGGGTSCLVRESCTLDVSAPALSGSFDVLLGIDPTSGELTLDSSINTFDLNVDVSGCGLIGDLLDEGIDLIDAIEDSFLGDFVLDLLEPTVDDLIDSLLPNPLGIANMMDVGGALEGISPGTEASLEARIVPGGYVRADVTTRGLSLGVITGINSDSNIATRTGTRPDGVPNASEPSLCVPPLGTVNFGAPPHNLPISSRSTFSLAAAGAFDGMPEPANADIAMGISETFLDLAGHHLVTSGAMCLGVGTSLIEQLNVGTIGILVPSLAELTSDTGKDPLLLVTRPQKAVDFSIGDNTAGSPALTIGLHNLEVDFYAFLYERYVRAFTLELTMNIGVNLEVEQQPGQPAFLKPMLSGISASSVTVKVLNSQFVAETPQHLEMVLPSVFNLVTPLLGNLPSIEVPSFAGFALNNPRISKVTTSQDDFLALYATIGASTLMRQLGQQDAWTQARVAEMDRQVQTSATQAHGTAKLRSVTTPAPEKVRAALLKRENGDMPAVVFDVDRFDDQGRELEWTYNLDGGMWRPYSTNTLGGFTIRDAAFAWQGKYHIGLRSRVKGDIHTASVEQVFPVIIDSVGPKVGAHKVQWDGNTVQIPLWDIVSEHHVAYAFGKPGEDEPSTEWKTGGMAELTRSELDKLVVNNEVLVFAKDEAGNTTIALVAPFHGEPTSEGCTSCQTGGGPSGGSIALTVIVGLVLATRRGRGRRLMVLARTTRAGRAVSTTALWLGASAAMSLQPGCSCGDPAAKACELAADCGPDFCPKGQLPFCIDGECVCSDDIPAGRVGPYSDVATGTDGSIWVSAYAQTYGDLVVAKVVPGRVPMESWEWVDGVPEGPVLVPDSQIRRGIDATGEDVGMYTSIAVSTTGVPMVTYFDRDSGSLKFAAKVNDAWQIHTIQSGTGIDPGTGSQVGMYTSLTLRSDNGNPGVAYLAHVHDANGSRAEVRYASAQVSMPTGPNDWQFWTVDTAPLPEEDPENPNIYPLPEGLGLFVDSARLPDQAPVVVYYDRGNGDLKVSKFNAQTGMFGTATVLDGSNGDAGWSPSVAVDAQGIVHVAYVSSSKDDLKYITDAPNAMPQVVDDGYRLVGTTVDGLPKPEFHFVGDDASLVLVNGTSPMIAYQDAMTQELLLAHKDGNGTWQRTSIAGATDPWPGAYGFFASSGLLETDLVMSTWVINQPSTNPFDNNWVEVFSRATTIQ